MPKSGPLPAPSLTFKGIHFFPALAQLHRAVTESLPWAYRVMNKPLDIHLCLQVGSSPIL